MSLYNPYSGRLGDRMDQVYSLSNDTKGGIVTTSRFVQPEEMLLWIGDCLSDLAKGGYFTTSKKIDIVANQQRYNLLALIPRLVKADFVRKTEIGGWIWNLQDDAMYATARQLTSSWETGRVGFLRGTNFYLVDAPGANKVDGLEVHYSFYPPYSITLSRVAVVDAGSGQVTFAAPGNELELGDSVMIYGSTNYSGTHALTAVTDDTFTIAATYIEETIGADVTCHCEPRFPITSDVMLTYWCLWQQAIKDRKSSSSEKDLQLYGSLYQAEKTDLLDDGGPPFLQLRKSR